MSLQELTLMRQHIDLLKALLEEAEDNGHAQGSGGPSLLSLVSPQESLTLETLLTHASSGLPVRTENSDVESW